MGIHVNRLIRLDFGEPSFPCPAEAKAEAIKYITNPDCYYSPIKGEKLLIEKIRDYLASERSLNLSEELITVTSGGLMGLNSIIRCLKNQGVTKVYYPDPGFPPYKFLGYYNGVEMNPYSMTDEKEAIQSLITLGEDSYPKSSAFIITSPNNPNGITFSKESWNSVTEIMSSQFIICDNSFESFIFNESKNCLPPSGGNIFHSFSFSKSFAMADYRVGYVISPSVEWSEAISRDHWFSQLSTSVISQKAAIGALNCKKDYLSNTKQNVITNINIAIKKLRLFGMDVAYPEGGFFLWINIKDIGCSSDDFVQYALEHYKLSIISGSNFGENGNNYVRINCATDQLTLEEGLDRFIKCYKERSCRHEYTI